MAPVPVAQPPGCSLGGNAGGTACIAGFGLHHTVVALLRASSHARHVATAPSGDGQTAPSEHRIASMAFTAWHGFSAQIGRASIGLQYTSV